MGKLLNVANGADALSKNMSEFASAYFLNMSQAINAGEWSRVLHQAEELQPDFEFLQNKMMIFSDNHSKECYEFGRIAGITQLCLVLQKKSAEHQAYESLRQNSPRLVECIIFIGECGGATGRQIIEHLGMKYRSDLSNLMKRQQKYEYIISHKLGKSTFYSLTMNGFSFYTYYLEQKKGSSLDAKKSEWHNFYQAMITCLANDDLSKVSLAMEICKRDETMIDLAKTTEFENDINQFTVSLRIYLKRLLKKMLIENIKQNQEGSSYSAGIPTGNRFVLATGYLEDDYND